MKTFLCFLLTLTIAFADDSDPVDRFIAGNRQFANDIYTQLLADNNENILVSPFSAEAVIGVIQSGARGLTGDEIRTTFHLAATKEATEEEFKSVLPLIKSDFVDIYTASKIYVAKQYSISEEFKELVKDVYQAGSQDVNFVESAEAADEINEWVKEKTDGLIDNFVNFQEFDEQTVVVLLNALYFQGNWTRRFDLAYSKKSLFYTKEDSTVESVMMSGQADFYNYYESAELDAQILELPFEGGEAAFTIVLPNKKEGIAFLEKQIGNVFAKPQYTQKIVQVSIPRFQINTTLDAKELLSKLGIKQAFSASAADFTGIAGNRGDLYISGAKQQATINVNENGVVAGAVTEFIISDTAVLTPEKFFIADHPFVFYLTFKDIVLFQGRVLVPEV